MNTKVNEDLVARLRAFIENEMRSCSMDIAGITPLYVQRMWGGTETLEESRQHWRWRKNSGQDIDYPDHELNEG